MGKKYVLRCLSLILLVSFSLLVFAACGSKADNAASATSTSGSTAQPAVSSTEPAAKSAEPVKMTYWQFGSPTQEEDKDIPQDKWYITGAIKRFQDANPNVTMEMTVLPSENMADKFKAAGVAQNGPDVTFLNVGGMMVDNKQFLKPLESYFTAEELAKIGNNILPAREGYKADGALLGIPLTGIDTLVLFYNKALFKKAGFDENVSLKTMDDLFAASEALKKAGIMPLAVGDKDGGVCSVFFLLTMYASATGNDGIQNKVQGKDMFSTDKDWIDSVKAWQEMYKRGYTNKDVASAESGAAQAIFLSQQAAMFCTGEWLSSSAAQSLGTDLGIVTVPSLRADVKYPGAIVGGPGNAYVVTNYSKNPDLAVKFIKQLITKDEVEKEITERYHGGNLTWNTDVSDSVITDPTTKMIKALITTNNVIPWLDNQLPAEVSSEMYRINPLMLSGKLTAEEYSKQLDNILAKVLKK